MCSDLANDFTRRYIRLAKEYAKKHGLFKPYLLSPVGSGMNLCCLFLDIVMVFCAVTGIALLLLSGNAVLDAVLRLAMLCLMLCCGCQYCALEDR
jgi:hypothetical protein